MIFSTWHLNGLINRLGKSRITHNVIALSGIQIATYVVPLSVVPYLARVLGPSSWGLVALAQAFGLYLSMIIDFGFQLSGARKVARFQDNREEIECILADVMGAKIILAVACVGAVLVAQRFVPIFRQNSLMLWAGALSGIGQGFSMLWLYQGLERMRSSSVVDIVAKIVAAGGVFLFVHNPDDAWKVLGLQFFCTSMGAFVLLVMAYREFSFKVPGFGSVVRALKESASMFLFRSAVSLYTTANALILGAVATPASVGFYSGAERIARGVVNLINPVSQSLFPRLSRLIVVDQNKAILLFRLSLAVMASFGLIVGIILSVEAPLIVRILLGRGYESVVQPLRILSILIPSVALSNVLGMQWMLPLGMDKEFNRIIISAGIVNIGLASWWATKWQQTGMSWAVATAEVVVTVLLFLTLIMSKLGPFSKMDDLTLQIRTRMAAEIPN